MKDDRVMPITVKMGLERLQVAVRESEMLEPYAQHEKRFSRVSKKANSGQGYGVLVASGCGVADIFG